MGSGVELRYDARVATERRDIVIVGAGLAGAATAWHLAQRGVTDVLLLDREPAAGMHSSGRNAGLLREKVDVPAWQPLTTEGAAVLRSGEFAGFARTGSVLLGWGDRDVRDFVPRARGRGLWCPEDGIVDVPALLASYLEGREVRWNAAARGWRRDGADMVVETVQGEFRARVVVNAAGAWAGVLGGMDIRPTNRHLFVSTPMDGVDASWPFVWDVDRGLYFRPESGGLLLSVCD
jgi:D-arginine dehydrogenase